MLKLAMSMLAVLTPTNLESEYVRFQADEDYSPQLEYKSTEAERTEIINSASKIFETVIDPTNLKLAEKIISFTPAVPPQPSIEEVKLAFERAFADYGLDYTFKLSDKHGFNFRPNFKRRKLFMSRYADFQFFSVEGEIRHELTHIRRYENGVKNNITPSPNYLPTEEGLASLMQDNYGQEAGSYFQHAAEYVASRIGLKSGFQDVYRFFTSIGFNKKLAWQRAIRHKFGFQDTSLPGDILKPAMYFHHEQKLMLLPKSLIEKLFVGKVSLEEVRR